MRIYARAGVSHAWLVDPLVRTLQVYRYQGPGAAPRSIKWGKHLSGEPTVGN